MLSVAMEEAGAGTCCSVTGSTPPPPAPSRPFSPCLQGASRGHVHVFSGASLRRAVLGKLRATNMHVEGLIAEFRQQSLQRKGRPNLESVHYLGLLGQVLKDFVADGNVHPLKQDTRSSSAADSQWPQKLGPRKKIPYLPASCCRFPSYSVCVLS